MSQGFKTQISIPPPQNSIVTQLMNQHNLPSINQQKNQNLQSQGQNSQISQQHQNKMGSSLLQGHIQRRGMKAAPISINGSISVNNIDALIYQRNLSQQMARQTAGLVSNKQHLTNSSSFNKTFTLINNQKCRTQILKQQQYQTYQGPQVAEWRIEDENNECQDSIQDKVQYSNFRKQHLKSFSMHQKLQLNKTIKDSASPDANKINSKKHKMISVIMNLPGSYRSKIQVQVPIYDGKESLSQLNKDLKQFFDECNQRLKCKRANHIFLPNGTPIYTLEDIPQECKEIIVSQQPVLNGPTMVQRSMDFSTIQVTNVDKSSISGDYHHTQDTKQYLKRLYNKDKRQLDVDSFNKELSKYGKDLLKDKAFYKDISESTSNKLKDILQNNLHFDEVMQNSQERLDSLNQNSPMRKVSYKKQVDGIQLIRPNINDQSENFGFKNSSTTKIQSNDKTKIIGLKQCANETLEYQTQSMRQNSLQTRNYLSTQQQTTFEQSYANNKKKLSFGGVMKDDSSSQRKSLTKKLKLNERDDNDNITVTLETEEIEEDENESQRIMISSSSSDSESGQKSENQDFVPQLKGSSVDNTSPKSKKSGQVQRQPQQRLSFNSRQSTMYNKQFELCKQLERKKTLKMKELKDEKENETDVEIDQSKANLQKYANIIDTLLIKEEKDNQSKLGRKKQHRKHISQDSQEREEDLVIHNRNSSMYTYGDVQNEDGQSLKRRITFINELRGGPQSNLSQSFDYTNSRSLNQTSLNHGGLNGVDQGSMKLNKSQVREYMQNMQTFKRNKFIISQRGTRPKKHAINYIEQNIKQCLKEQVCQTVDQKYKALVGLNIPKLQLDCSFTRTELYGFYSKFKALAKLSKLSDPSQVEIGVTRDIFMNCMKQLSLDNTDLLEKIYDSVNKGNKTYINWDEFFSTMKLISSNNLTDKIDLFFDIIDSDGNGMFSFDEIRDICKLSLSKIEQSENTYNEYMEDFCDFYARYIFKLLGKQIDEEIPTDVFKQAVNNGSQETREILSMFCCADAQAMNKQVE